MSTNQTAGGDPPNYNYVERWIQCERCGHIYRPFDYHICNVPDHYSYMYTTYPKSEIQLLQEILEILKQIENKLDS